MMVYTLFDLIWDKYLLNIESFMQKNSDRKLRNPNYETLNREKECRNVSRNDANNIPFVYTLKKMVVKSFPRIFLFLGQWFLLWCDAGDTALTVCNIQSSNSEAKPLQNSVLFLEFSTAC